MSKIHNGNLDIHGNIRIQGIAGSDVNVVVVDASGNVQNSNISMASISGSSFVENIDYYIENGSNSDVIIRQYCWYPFTLESVAIKTVIGSITANVRKNGVSVVGIDNISVSPTISLASSSSNNTFAVGDYLDIDFTNNSAASGISISIKIVKS